MSNHTFLNPRSFLLALSFCGMFSAVACANTVDDRSDDATDSADALKGGKPKPALAIRYADLPPIGGSSSSSGGCGSEGSSVATTTSTGTGWGTSGSGVDTTTSTGTGWGTSGSGVATATSTGSGWGTSGSGGDSATSTGSGWGTSGSGGDSGTGGCGPGSGSSGGGYGGSGGWGAGGDVGQGGFGSATTSVGQGGYGGESTTTGGGYGGESVTSTSVGYGDPSTTNSVSVGQGGGTDPDTLFLNVGSSPLVCSDPYGSYACGNWHLSIGLPPALQHKGTIPLTWSLPGGFSESGPDEGGGFCSGGGGSLLGGTLTILKINKKRVTFRLEGTDAMFFSEVNADGTYEADLCGSR